MVGSLPTIETFARSSIGAGSPFAARIVTALSCQSRCLGETGIERRDAPDSGTHARTLVLGRISGWLRCLAFQSRFSAQPMSRVAAAQ